MKAIKIENVKKIAILRANALGDFIVTIPAINAIKETYPEAELILLGSPWHKEFLTPGRTSIDRVIIVPAIKGIRDANGEPATDQEIHQFFQEIHKEFIDIAIHFQGQGFAGNPFLKRLGAKITAGHKASQAEPVDQNLLYYYYQNEISRYLEVAMLIGARPTALEPEINVFDKDTEEAKSAMPSLNKNYIVIHPCGTDKRRMWENRRFSTVADELIEKGYQVVFTGVKSDESEIEIIISGMKNKALNASGKLSLGGLAALLKGSKLVISIDTGPLHLAQAVGAKTIGLYWAPNLINWGPLTRKMNYPLISWSMNCPICGAIPNTPFPFLPANKCDHPVSFIRDITVTQVTEAAYSLLYK